MLGVPVLQRMGCPCVAPEFATRLPTPGSALSSEPKTGLRSGSARALQPIWRTLFGPKHKRYRGVLTAWSHHIAATSVTFFLSVRWNKQAIVDEQWSYSCKDLSNSYSWTETYCEVTFSFHSFFFPLVCMPWSEFPVVVGVYVKSCRPWVHSEKTIHRRTRKQFH